MSAQAGPDSTIREFYGFIYGRLEPAGSHDHQLENGGELLAELNTQKAQSHKHPKFSSPRELLIASARSARGAAFFLFSGSLMAQECHLETIQFGQRISLPGRVILGFWRIGNRLPKPLHRQFVRFAESSLPTAKSDRRSSLTS